MIKIENIGCHFKLEKFNGNYHHNTELLFSSGRNCLRYIINQRNIKKIYLPYFLCESLSEVCMLDRVDIEYYHVGNDLFPIDDNIKKLDENTYIYLVNYFGLLNEEISIIIDKYQYVIVDNTHNFFDNNIYDSDTIYNYRKYFGVPDGACVVSKDLKYAENVIIGKSLDKIIEIVSRDETGEYFHYQTFDEADKYYKNEDLCYMSNFTKNYIKAIPYDYVLNRRLINFNLLHDYLKKLNGIDLDGKNNINFMYPLFVKNGEELRKYLLENNIYSQMLWPPVNWNGSSKDEKNYASNMVLLPIDQRYGEREMDYIASKIKKYYK